jgi:uncharacterized protein YdeI (YjbR/CyaY-like superfamily)
MVEQHHTTTSELIVGYYKKAQHAGTTSESVDEALCFGWIDGVRKGLDDERYQIRFTPRKRDSNWSAVNIRKAEELIEQGLMRPAGLAAFEARREERSAVYSYEQTDPSKLNEAYDQQLRANKTAWIFFESSSPSYRRAAIHWVMSAKREETQRRRLATLIDDSAQGRTIPPLTPRRSER